LTFLTVVKKDTVDDVRCKLLELCDEAIVLPSIYLSNAANRIFHKLLGTVFTLVTGLKFSNYLYGRVEFSTSRLAPVLDRLTLDGVLFEYWHAFKVTQLLRERGIPSALDMHDILWRSYSSQLDANHRFPGWLKKWLVRRYQAREESAWNHFDALIAINQDEYNYARQRVHGEIHFFNTPMGTDLSLWPACWQPVTTPRRVAYYGGLGSLHNQQDAHLCYREIMPVIWEQFPDVELWIVGNDPPAIIKDLERDARMHVTGFVENPQDILKTMSLVLCPWSGTYGFRSRLVEVMALGVPVVASQEAVFGMCLDEGQGIVLAETPAAMAERALNWISNPMELQQQSLLARSQMERKFSYQVTYVLFSNVLLAFLKA
jgi:glycosyltransferase involved in cell wall biosynthesis